MVKSYEEKLAILTEWFPSLEIPPRATAWLSRPDVSVEMVAECLVVNPPVDFFPPRPLKFPRAAIIDSKADPLFAEQPQHDEIVGQQDLSEWHSWRELQAADYFDFDFCLSEPCSPDYIKQSQQLVTGEQPQIQAGAIRFIMRSFRFRYAPSSKALDDAVERFLKAEKIISLDAKKRQTIVLSVSLPSGLKQEFQVEILSKPRSSRSDFNHVCPELLKEIQWLRYRESVAECHVCYNLVPTQQLIVCVDGHSFCPGCLRSQAKEALFGGGKRFLICLSYECNQPFSRAALEKNLSKELLNKLDERLQEEEINMASISGLFRCQCGYGAIIEVPVEVDRVFRCAKCSKETCRICENEWDEFHFGRSCKETEDRDEDTERKHFEEKMAAVVIRQCPKCKTAVMKEDGCNKMTCRCGETFCYLCKTAGIDYDHFCRHPLEPGHPCFLCNSCLLWENPELRDRKALEDLEKQRKEESRRGHDKVERRMLETA